jgi:tetratricopeptide (TPR) repeat protein
MITIVQPLAQRRHLTTVLVILAAVAGCNQFDKLLAKRNADGNAANSPTKSQNGWFSSRKSKAKTPDELFQLARDSEKSGDPEQALEAYDRVIAAQANHAAAHHRLAIVHEQLGNGDLAEHHFQMALEQIPEDPELRCDYSYSLYLRGQYSLANEQLSMLLKKSPNHARANMHLGLVQASLGDTEQAMKCFAKAGCKPAEAHANLAYVLTAQDKWPEAASHLQVAMTHDPKSEQFRSRFAEIQALLATNEPDAESIAKVGFVEDAVKTDPVTARISD